MVSLQKRWEEQPWDYHSALSHEVNIKQLRPAETEQAPKRMNRGQQVLDPVMVRELFAGRVWPGAVNTTCCWPTLGENFPPHTHTDVIMYPVYFSLGFFNSSCFAFRKKSLWGWFHWRKFTKSKSANRGIIMSQQFPFFPRSTMFGFLIWIQIYEILLVFCIFL